MRLYIDSYFTTPGLMANYMKALLKAKDVSGIIEIIARFR